MAKLKSLEENRCIYINKKNGWCKKIGMTCPNNPDCCEWHIFFKK